MKTVTKTFIGLTLMFVITSNIFSMQPSKKSVAKWARIAGEILLGNVPVSQLSQLYSPQQQIDPFPFTSLPRDEQSVIITFLTSGTNAQSLKEATYSIGSLAQVNHELNELINNDRFSLNIIKHLAQRFNCSQFDVCKALQTQQAKHQCHLQKQLFDLCVQDDPNMNLFALLSNQGADLEFTYTYEDHIATPLMIACLNNNSTLARHLLHAGANINHATPSGMTALMLTALTNNRSAMYQLLNGEYSGNIIVDKQDRQGNTALIYAILNKNIMYVRALLAHGANPTLSNAAGLTPSKAAQQVGDEEIIDTIYKAING